MKSVRDRLVDLRESLMVDRKALQIDNAFCDAQGMNASWNTGAILQIDNVVIEIDAIIAEPLDLDELAEKILSAVIAVPSIDGRPPLVAAIRKVLEEAI